MNMEALLNISNAVGKLESLIRQIDCGTLVTKKNEHNAEIKASALQALEFLKINLKNINK